MIDWNNPVARLKLLDEVGPQAYNEAIEAWFAKCTVEICNGYALREIASSFGKVISVDGTRQAFKDLERARSFAMGLKPGTLQGLPTPDPA